MNGMPHPGKTTIHDQDHLFVIAGTATQVTLAIKASVELTSKTVTENDVLEKLHSLGIIHGIDRDRIQRQLREKEYNQPIEVVRWTPPENGQDARMEQIIRTQQEGKPQINQDGSADFRNIDNIVQVSEGQVLAVKKPATNGRPGKDVFGNTVPQIFGRDISLPAGFNTRISEDGSQVIAKKAGFLFRQHGTLCVGETYEVQGGVNYKSGNVRFAGDVIIHGTVSDGFTVEAGGSLVIHGDVEGAELSAGKGGISIEGGIFGKDKAFIKSEGTLRVGMAQQVRMECRELVVTKSLIHCQVKAWDVKANTPGCLVHGGTLLCYGDVSLYLAGHEGDRTDIIMLNEEEEELRATLADLVNQENSISPGVEAAEKRLKQIKSMMDKTGAAMPAKVAIEVKQLLSTLTEGKKKLQHLQAEKIMVLQMLETPQEKRGVFRIFDRPQWGVNLNLFHFEKKLTPEDGKKEIRLVGTQLVEYSLADL